MKIEVSPTPNPNAMKFIVDRPVKQEGNSTYKSPSECGENQLALTLFTIRGVDHLHFFDNAITVTKFSYEEWESMIDQVQGCLREKLPGHNPDYFDPDPEGERRQKLSPELAAIEEILDRTIRYGLQADGGDLQCLSYDDHVLIVRYQGACGTCPSASTGTLETIKFILRDEFDPQIEVYIAPES